MYENPPSPESPQNQIDRISAERRHAQEALRSEADLRQAAESDHLDLETLEREIENYLPVLTIFQQELQLRKGLAEEDALELHGLEMEYDSLRWELGDLFALKMELINARVELLQKRLDRNQDEALPAFEISDEDVERDPVRVREDLTSARELLDLAADDLDRLGNYLQELIATLQRSRELDEHYKNFLGSSDTPNTPSEN